MSKTQPTIAHHLQMLIFHEGHNCGLLCSGRKSQGFSALKEILRLEDLLRLTHHRKTNLVIMIGEKFTISDLKDYINNSSEKLPSNFKDGVPSKWMFLDELSVTKNSMWFGDPFIADAEDGFLGKVENGVYLIEVKGFDYNGFRVIGRLRARLKQMEDFRLGSEVGETGTDSALISVCDMFQLDEAIDNENDKFQEVIDNFNFNRFGTLEFKLSNNIKIIYVNSGFGDGAGPVFELLDKSGGIIGFELNFISETED